MFFPIFLFICLCIFLFSRVQVPRFNSVLFFIFRFVFSIFQVCVCRMFCFFSVFSSALFECKKSSAFDIYVLFFLVYFHILCFLSVFSIRCQLSAFVECESCVSIRRV